MFFYYNDLCEILRVIKHNRHLDLGNSSNKFGNHWFRHLNFITSGLSGTSRCKLKSPVISISREFSICASRKFDHSSKKSDVFRLFARDEGGRIHNGSSDFFLLPKHYEFLHLACWEFWKCFVNPLFKIYIACVRHFKLVRVWPTYAAYTFYTKGVRPSYSETLAAEMMSQILHRFKTNWFHVRPTHCKETPQLP